MSNLKVATKTHLHDGSGNATGVLFEFNDGSEIRASLSQLSDKMIDELAVHGLKQKIGDSYAGCKGDGRLAATLAKQVYDNLQNGIWATRVSNAGILLEALIRIFPDADAGELASKLASASTEEKTAMRKNAQVKAMIKKIELERAEAAAAGTELNLDDLI